MILLILFAFLAGIVTILSPCILPVLPIILSGSLTGGKNRPLGIVSGFVVSFTFFTLFLSTIVKATNISADALRSLAVILLVFFGISLLIPKMQIWMERLFSKLTSLNSQHSSPSSSSDFFSGIPIGMSLGLVWAPCVGPIIASVITLAATSQVNSAAVIITLFYSLGTALPMLAITYGGRQLLQKAPGLLANTGNIQKGFGVLMVITAIAIFFNFDRQVQSYILTVFPQYGTGLTKIEDNTLVKNALQQLKSNANPDAFGKPMNEVQNSQGSNLPRLAKAPGFTRASGEPASPEGGWINSSPLTMEELRGKVVLIDFWTYTCINCIRTLPYVENWYQKYKDKGLVIVGVHTPEFEFEKSVNNVKKAARDFKLTYPIVQDNSYGIWQEYNNQYWPAHYLIDKEGYIRKFHFGEGKYDEMEQAIQTLLSENSTTVTDTIDNPKYSIYAQTPETYLGGSRLKYSVSPERVLLDQPQIYSAPNTIPADYFAYDGTWTISGERAMPTVGAKLIEHFSAEQVFLVMRPKDPALKGMVRITLDGNPVIQGAGDDLIDSTVTVTDDRLYRLIKLTRPGTHILQLEFLDDNVELYAFTFG